MVAIRWKGFTSRRSHERPVPRRWKTYNPKYEDDTGKKLIVQRNSWSEGLTRRFLRRRYINSQQTHEKVPGVTRRPGGASENLTDPHATPAGSCGFERSRRRWRGCAAGLPPGDSTSDGILGVYLRETRARPRRLSGHRSFVYSGKPQNVHPLAVARPRTARAVARPRCGQTQRRRVLPRRAA